MSPQIDELVYWIGRSAVALMAAAGVLEAGRKRCDHRFGLMALHVAGWVAALASGAVIFLLRMVAIRWEIGLPRFTAKGP